MAITRRNTSKDLDQVSQYLLLGQEGSCYTAGWKKLQQRDVQSRCVDNLLADGKGIELVKEVQNSCERYTVDTSSRVYVLAVCAKNGDLDTRRAAYEALPVVCESSRDLFTFVRFSEQLSKSKGVGTGWGRAQRTAISRWYLSKSTKDLVEVCSSQPSDCGWSHRDVLRLAHVKSKDIGTAAVLRFFVKGFEPTQKEFATDETPDDVMRILEHLKVLNTLKRTKDENEAAALVETHSLCIDNAPNCLKKSAEVWRCVVPDLPLRQLLIHLRRFAQLGFLASNSGILPLILEQLRNADKIADSRLHPVDVYVAMKKYEELGKNVTGRPSAKRRPNSSVIVALNNLMVATIKHIPVTGKRYLVIVDVRNTMVHGKVYGCHYLMPAVAAALLFLPLLQVEDDVTVAAFGMRDIVVLNVKKGMSLSDVTKRMRETPMGGVNCAKPMMWAKQQKKLVDVFLIFTDNQIKVVDVKPVDALNQYRKAMNLPQSRLVICALSALKFNLAAADDPGMLDIAGFDVHVPHVIREFVTA